MSDLGRPVKPTSIIPVWEYKFIAKRTPAHRFNDASCGYNIIQNRLGKSVRRSLLDLAGRDAVNDG